MTYQYTDHDEDHRVDPPEDADEPGRDAAAPPIIVPFPASANSAQRHRQPFPVQRQGGEGPAPASPDTPHALEWVTIQGLQSLPGSFSVSLQATLGQTCQALQRERTTLQRLVQALSEPHVSSQTCQQAIETLRQIGQQVTECQELLQHARNRTALLWPLSLRASLTLGSLVDSELLRPILEVDAFRALGTSGAVAQENAAQRKERIELHIRVQRRLKKIDQELQEALSGLQEMRRLLQQASTPGSSRQAAAPSPQPEEEKDQTQQAGENVYDEH